MALQRFKYKDTIITYSGFKMENSYCFYGYFKDKLLYLLKSEVDKLEPIEKTETELKEEQELIEYFKGILT
jgi:hypothetical protein